MPIKKGARILVTGATGRQGGAVVRALLKKKYRVRAFTRDINSPNALKIKTLGAELVQGNFLEPTSIDAALKNVEGLFTMTTSFEGGVDAEVKQGINMIDAAKRAGIKHFVMTSVASANQQTGIPHFDSKYKVEKILEKADIPYTIIAPVSFMENLLNPMVFPGLQAGKISLFQDPVTPQQMIAVADIGEMAAAMMARGAAVFGKRFDIASDAPSGNRIAEILTRSTGRKIDYVQRDLNEMNKAPPEFAKMTAWILRVGYKVDIAALHAQFPEVPWHTFESWAKEQDWTQLKK